MKNILNLADQILDSVKFSYIPADSQRLLDNELRTLQSGLTKYQKFLAEHGEGMKEAQEYAEKGCDWRLKEAVEAARQYLDNFPEFMHQTILDQAAQTVDAEFIRRLKGAKEGCHVALDDVIIDKNGTWLLSKSLRERVTRQYEVTLTDTQVKTIELIKQMIVLADKLHNCNFFLEDELGLRSDFFTEMCSIPFQNAGAFAEFVCGLERLTEVEYQKRRLHYGL